MTALLASTDQFYWKTLTRLLVILRGLGRKKGHQFIDVLHYFSIFVYFMVALQWHFP